MFAADSELKLTQRRLLLRDHHIRFLLREVR